MSVAKRELLYFLVLFAIPCLGLAAVGMAMSSIPFPERLCTLDDTCPYASCFILPGLFWSLSRSFVLVTSLCESRRTRN